MKRFIKFSIVGLSGTVINMAVYALVLQNGLYYMTAAMISFLFAVTSNFYWNLRWTFKGKAAGRSVQSKYGLFLGISGISLGINLLLLGAFVEKFDMNKNLAQLVAVVLVSVLNFVMNTRVTFGGKRRTLYGKEPGGEEA
jgi:dolichol-phosphate mannosyltransferase